MDEKYKKIIEEKFDELPPEVKQAILSKNYEEILVNAQKKYTLSITQLSLLERETSMVLLGLMSPNQYSNELATQLLIPKDKAQELVTELNETLFKPIRTQLKEIYDDEESPMDINVDTRPAVKQIPEPVTKPETTTPQFAASQVDMPKAVPELRNPVTPPTSIAFSTPIIPTAQTTPTSDLIDIDKPIANSGLNTSLNSTPTSASAFAPVMPKPINVLNTKPQDTPQILNIDNVDSKLANDVDMNIDNAKDASRDAIIDVIENPNPAPRPATDLIRRKLENIIANPKQTSDHTVGSISVPNQGGTGSALNPDANSATSLGAVPKPPVGPSIKSSDPYREPV